MPYKDPAVQKQAQADWYQRNKELVDERTRSQKAVKYEHIRQLKEASPCTDCGVFYPYYVMDFDHITDDKVADIKWLVQHKGWQQVLDEIAKCELVCANCHRKRTHDRTHGVIV